MKQISGRTIEQIKLMLIEVYESLLRKARVKRGSDWSQRIIQRIKELER